MTSLLSAIVSGSQLRKLEEQKRLEPYLVSSEFRISVVRSVYNEAVGTYKGAIGDTPGGHEGADMPMSLLAGLVGHSARVTLDL